MPQISWGHLESRCGQREPSSQPLNTYPRRGIHTFPHLTAPRPTNTKATSTRGETARHQPGSKTAQRSHPDPGKDLPSCCGQWEGGEDAGEQQPRAGDRQGCVASGREGGRWLPHPALLHLSSTV